MDEDNDSVRSEHFAILRAAMTCWKCKTETPVSAIWIDSDLSGSAFDDGPGVATYIESLNPEAERQIREHAPGMRMASSASTQTVYLANHCMHCDALQGDHFVHGVDGPFFPQTEDAIARIEVIQGNGPLVADASVSQSGWMGKLD